MRTLCAILGVNMATKKEQEMVDLKKSLSKARSQARNERNKRIAFIEGTKYGLELAREAGR